MQKHVVEPFNAARPTTPLNLALLLAKGEAGMAPKSGLPARRKIPDGSGQVGAILVLAFF